MNAIIIHSGDVSSRRIERRALERRSFGRALAAPSTGPADRPHTEAASRQRVRVRRRPDDEPFETPRRTGDPRTQIYADHEDLPGPWASWQFINYLI
ncbi:MAG: hypothetical protein GVY16_02370 [Planctomycetes bacterium]|nr:hypothetical protein [Phycisphaerae bacterium]NBB94562.1 hypothetical protein [Planctomycetota bacterium]